MSHKLALSFAAGLAAGLPSIALAQQPIAASEDGCWTMLDRMPAEVTAAEAWVRPLVFAPARLDFARIGRVLGQAPPEAGPGAAGGMVIWLPMPGGGFARFRVVDSPIMEPPLAARFPQIRTYLGQGIDDPSSTARLDHTPLGFHAQVLAPSGAVYIDPYSRGDTTHYAVYFKRDLRKAPDGWVCHTEEQELHLPPPPPAGGVTDSPSGATLRTYRLANACTGEYTAFFGGTVTAGQAAIVTAINRVTGVYESEMCIRLVLIANNSSLVYTNSGTDPYTNNNGGTMLGQNQSNLDSVIGNANYDIGHVFSTGGGGIAGLGVVGVTGSKARGVTGLGSPTGDAFYIDYVAHEMGHQFGANHNFNSTTGSCSGNRSSSHAYEPGSASTIMGYAGICGADDLQPHSDPYFGFDGHDAIITYTSSGSGLGNTNVATGNGIPTVNAGPNYTIPWKTPFTLTATGSDPNGDPLTYSWEERDLGPAATVASGDNGSSPIIRVLNPSTSPSRTIPRLANLLNNTFAFAEILPTTARTLNFRVTARDNRSGGAASNNDDTVLTVVSSAGPFLVTYPNGGESLSGTQTVTWNVANTSVAPVSTANVTILLSTDGGNTFPTTLAASTPNDGSQSVVLPNLTSSTARVKVAAVGNIYFDISNANFSITPSAPPSCPTFTTQPAPTITICDGDSFTLTVAATGSPAPTYQWRRNLSDILGATASSYQVLFANSSQTGSYTCVATNSCGSTTSNAAVVNVNTGPVVTGQPASQSVPQGSSVVFSVTATMSPGYQWRKNSTDIPGATGDSYSITAAAASDAGTYDCFLSNACGSAYSDAATLTVNPPPCYADVNGDGNLDSNDFNAFLVKFLNADPSADCTGDGNLDSNDFNCLLVKFLAGCA